MRPIVLLLVLPVSAQIEGESSRQVTVQYYDFLINEWSFKFWAVFQLLTIAVLLYSTFAAIYYAKWTYLKEVDSPDYEANFVVRRSDSPAIFDSRTLLRILEAISKPPAVKT